MKITAVCTRTSLLQHRSKLQNLKATSVPQVKVLGRNQIPGVRILSAENLSVLLKESRAETDEARELLEEMKGVAQQQATSLGTFLSLALQLFDGPCRGKADRN